MADRNICRPVKNNSSDGLDMFAILIARLFIFLLILDLTWIANIDQFADRTCQDSQFYKNMELAKILRFNNDYIMQNAVSISDPPTLVPEIVIIIIKLAIEYRDDIINWFRRKFGSPSMPRANSSRRGRLEANREKIGEWEEFKIVANNDGTYSFAAHTGFLCAECGGCGEVVADRLKIGEWEKWKLIKHKDGTVSLCTLSGYYLCAEEDGRVVADREKIGPWEKFTLIIDLEKKTCAFKCWHGKFISAQP